MNWFFPFICRIRALFVAVLVLHGFAPLLLARQSGDFTYTSDGAAVTITGSASGGKSLVVPSSIMGLPVTAIAAEAFSGKGDLALVTIPAGVTAIGDGAFQDCPVLARIVFEGDAPTLGGEVFQGTAPGLTLYHYAGAGGFDVSEWQGRRVVETAPHARYRYYRFVTLRTKSSSTYVQLSEFSFFWFGQRLAPLAVANPGGYRDMSPVGEGPQSLLDRSVNTKWMDYNRAPLVFDFVKPTPIDAYAFAAGNHEFGRNPVSWRIDGSNDGTDWETLDEQDVPEAVPDSPFAPAGPFLIHDEPDDEEPDGPSEPPDIVIVQPVDAIVVDASSTLPLAATTTGGLDVTWQWYEGESGDTSQPIPGATSREYQAEPSASLRYWVRATSSDGSADSDTVVLTLTDPADHFTQIQSGYAFVITGYNGPSSAQSVMIPPALPLWRVVAIGDNAFAGGSFSDVTIPASVTSIGAGAFADCPDLTDVVIPSSVSHIGKSAFSGCTSLADVTIPFSVTVIEGSAFAGCTHLASVTFRGDAPSLGPDAFRDAAPGFTIYYYEDRSGFGSPDWHGYRTVMLPGESRDPPTPPSLAEALDQPEFVFTTGVRGAIPWASQTTVGHDGEAATAAATSFHSANAGKSQLSTTVTGPGTLSFWWRLSSRDSRRYSGLLEFHVADKLFYSKRPSFPGWEQRTVSLGAGAHTLTWSGSTTVLGSWDDAGLVDRVEWTPLEGPLGRYYEFAADAGLSGGAAEPDAIPHHDGVANLLKYAFNMDLSGPDVSTLAPGGGVSGLPVGILGGQPEEPEGGNPAVLQIEFLRRLNSGLVYTVEFSSALSDGGDDSWAAATGTPEVIPIDDEWERVIVRDDAPAPHPKRFGRVRVELANDD